MPMIDMPLDQLRSYEGRNPKPDDFDAYWDRALDEMHALDPQVELAPASFEAAGVECFDLTFTGVGGARVYAKYLRPAGKRDCGAVLQFHGYTGSSGEWWDKLAFVQAGYCVAALDARGQGGRSRDAGGVAGTTFKGHIIRGLDDAPERLLFRQIFLDTAQLAGIVMGFGEVDAARVSAMGGSQGGALTLACAALTPTLHKAAPQEPFLSDYRRVWEMDLARGAYEELRTYLRQFDPRHEREHEVFERLGYIDVAHLAARIRCPVLWGIGLMDDVCPPSTQFAGYNRISAPKEMRIYPDYGHEALPGFLDEAFGFLTDRWDIAR